MINYEFDIFHVLNDEIFEMLKKQKGIYKALKKDGLTYHAEKNKVALFRDAKAGRALKASHPDLLKAFQDSGFGLNQFYSGAPAGRYPASDEESRKIRTNALADRLEKLDLEVINQGPFDVHAFVSAVRAARPIADRKVPTKRRKKRRPPLVSIVLGVAVGYLILLASRHRQALHDLVAPYLF